MLFLGFYFFYSSSFAVLLIMLLCFLCRSITFPVCSISLCLLVAFLSLSQYYSFHACSLSLCILFALLLSATVLLLLLVLSPALNFLLPSFCRGSSLYFYARFRSRFVLFALLTSFSKLTLRNTSHTFPATLLSSLFFETYTSYSYPFLSFFLIPAFS